MRTPILQSNAIRAPEGREEEWLDMVLAAAAVAKHTGEKFAPILIWMTPALARALLKHNTWNRVLKKAAVDNLLTEEAAGNWMYTSLPILVDWNGEVADGQHRITFVERSGKEAMMTLSLGLDPSVRLLVDSQSPRSVANTLDLMQRGVPNTNEVTAAAGYLWAWENKGVIPTNSTIKATRGQRIGFAIDQIERLKDAVGAVPKNKVMSRSILATMRAYLTARSTPPELVDTFITTLVRGVNLQEGDPIMVARNWLLNDTRKDLREPNKRFDLLVQTWNAWRRGDQMKRRPTLRGTLAAIEA